MKILEKLKLHKNLDYNSAKDLQIEILRGNLTKDEIIKIFQHYESNKITAEEFVGFVDGAKSEMKTFRTEIDALDTAGTGGDGLNTFNISSTASIVISASGVPVAKHGNRSSSSKSGSADVFEQLGININLTPEQAKVCLEKIGIVFMFAPNFHQGFKYASEARKEYGKPTFFNQMGPLLNPANVKFQIIGVADTNYANLMGESLIKAGSKKIWIVHDKKKGMDEISPFGYTQINEYTAKGKYSFEINGANFDLHKGKPEDLNGGIKEVNAAISRNVLLGKSNPSQRAVVILNAAAGIFIYGKAQSFEEAVEIASKTIDSGLAMKKLEEFILVSNSF